MSSNGKLLAIGSADNNIYLYKVNEDNKRNFSRLGRCVVRT